MSARTLAGRLALLAGGTALGLVLAEVGLRLRRGALGAEFLLAETASLYDTSILREDAETLVSLAPGRPAHMRTPEYDQHVRVNAMGLRGPEVPPRAPDELRVLLVGDSFTLGVQVAENELFAAHLAQGLTEALGRPVTVWNSGVDSVGTFQQTLLARRLAPRLGADLVVWIAFTGNDLSDNHAFPEAVRRAGRGHTRSPRPPPTGPLPWLTRRSMLAQYLRIVGRSMDRSWPGRARHHRELGIFTSADTLAQEGRATVEALAELPGACADLQVRCAMAVAAPAFVVHPERRRATFWYFGHDPDAVDPDAPTRFFLDHTPPAIPTLDLTPPLRAAAEAGGPPLYFTLDGHWTAEGHRVVGAALTPWLAASLSR